MTQQSSSWRGSAPWEAPRGLGRQGPFFSPRTLWTLALFLAASRLPARGQAAPPPAPASPPLAAPGGVAPIPAINGESAILMDAETGAVLLEKNADEPRPMASLTKVMTAILVLESGRLDETVTVSKRASETLYSSLHLKTGEKLTLHDLLVGILLRSANDACVAAAEFLDGSVEQFVARMNQRAAELGLRNTSFANPHGLHDPAHYSTARDLAILTRYAVQFPVFNELVGSRRMVIARQDPKGDRLITSRSRLLWRMPDADGVKTGYTRQAGNCFIGSATRGGWRLISVVLKSHSVYPDTQALLEYGFARFRRHLLVRRGAPMGEALVRGGAEGRVALRAAEDVYTVQPAERVLTPRIARPVVTVTAPVYLHHTLGKAVVWDGAKPLAAVDLVAAVPVETAPALTAALGGSLGGSSVPWLLVALGLVFIGYGTNTKAALRRWRRLQKRSRRVDPRRKTYR